MVGQRGTLAITSVRGGAGHGQDRGARVSSPASGHHRACPPVSYIHAYIHPYVFVLYSRARVRGYLSSTIQNTASEFLRRRGGGVCIRRWSRHGTRRIIGSLDCWIVGSLDRWIVGSLAPGLIGTWLQTTPTTRTIPTGRGGIRMPMRL